MHVVHLKSIRQTMLEEPATSSCSPCRMPSTAEIWRPLFAFIFYSLVSISLPPVCLCFCFLQNPAPEKVAKEMQWCSEEMHDDHC